jgi:hypothetical protein
MPARTLAYTATIAIAALVAVCVPQSRAQPAPVPSSNVVEPKTEPSVEEPPPAPTAQPAPPMNEEEQQAIALLTDLQRYASETAEDLRRELAAANQAVNRARTDANRIRLAVLVTMPAAGPPDDARALALLDSVVGKSAGSSPVKQLAAVLYLQIAERARGISEERKKSAAAQEKLDQLRAVERSLLLERSRNAGGAGGGGGGGTGR